MAIQVTEQDGRACILIDPEDIHAFRVALQPIRVGEVTSNRTREIREGTDRRLARIKVSK